MSHASTQSSFRAPAPSGRRRFDAPPTAVSSEPSHASAYRAVHGPRLAPTYQSSYQRDYAAVEDYLKLKREKEARRAADEAADRREDDGSEQSPASPASRHSSRRSDEGGHSEEDSGGRMSESELAAESESVLDDGGYEQRRALADEDEAAELQASSTFVPYQQRHRASRAEDSLRPAFSSVSSSRSGSDSASSSPSVSSHSSAARSNLSSHSRHAARHSVSSLPIDAWQRGAAPSRAVEYGDAVSQRSLERDERWNEERALNSQRTAQSAHNGADTRHRSRREEDPAIQRLRESLHAARLDDLPPPSSSLSSAAVSPYSSSSASRYHSAHSSQPASPPRLPARRVVGDRDSDWRPSRRILQPHNQQSEPGALRYTPIASYPASTAASASSSMGDSGSTSPTASSGRSRGRRLRGEAARIDPSSVAYAAGMPTHRRAASSPYGSESVASALSAPASLPDTPLLDTPLLAASSHSSRAHTPLLQRASGRRRAQPTHEPLAAVWPEERREEDEAGGQHATGREHSSNHRGRRVGEAEGDGIRNGAGEEKRGDKWRERKPSRRDKAAPRHTVDEGSRAEASLLASARRTHRIRDERVQIDDGLARQTEAAATAAPPSLRQAGHTARRADPYALSALPSSYPAAPALSAFTATATRHARSPLTGYGYGDVTPGSIERQWERERLQYEAELKRIRESHDNTLARVALRERNYTGTQPL